MEQSQKGPDEGRKKFKDIYVSLSSNLLIFHFRPTMYKKNQLNDNCNTKSKNILLN